MSGQSLDQHRGAGCRDAATAPFAVRDIMTAEIVAATPRTRVAHIAQLMNAKALSGLPVIDEGDRVVGIVTDFDLIVDVMVRNPPAEPRLFLSLLEDRLLEPLNHFRKPVRRMAGLEAKDIMTPDVVTIGPDEDVEELADLMVKTGISVVPVVERGRLIGVATRADIVHWMTCQDEKVEGET